MKTIQNPEYEAALYELRYIKEDGTFVGIIPDGFTIRTNDRDFLGKLLRGEVSLNDAISPVIQVPDEYCVPKPD